MAGEMGGNVGRLGRLLRAAGPEGAALLPLFERAAPVVAGDRRQWAPQILGRLRPDAFEGADRLRASTEQAPIPGWRPERPSLDDGRSGLRMVIRPNAGTVWGVEYVRDLPGGPRLLSWDGDHTIRWWDGAAGAPIG